MDTSAARSFERHHIEAFRLIRLADEERDAGRFGVARILRRKAAGHRAAATRIARREGWMA